MEFAINYGLIVVDPSEQGDKTILHFCGFTEKPSDRDFEFLRGELRDDPEFGLQEIWDKVEILEAPENIVEEYKKIISETPNENE